MHHWHIITDCSRYIPQRWLSTVAERFGLGRVVDVRAVRSQGVVSYLCTYLGKAGCPRGFRKITSSKAFFLAKLKAMAFEEWQIHIPKESKITTLQERVTSRDIKIARVAYENIIRRVKRRTVVPTQLVLSLGGTPTALEQIWQRWRWKRYDDEFQSNDG